MLLKIVQSRIKKLSEKPFGLAKICQRIGLPFIRLFVFHSLTGWQAYFQTDSKDQILWGVDRVTKYIQRCLLAWSARASW